MPPPLPSRARPDAARARAHNANLRTPQQKQTFILYLKADLENVGRITCDRLSTRWCLTVKESAGSEERDGVFVTASETHELSGSKGTANLVMKFAKGAKHESYVNVLEIKGVTRDITAEDDGKFVPFVAFECRGLEPIAYRATSDDPWRVESSGGGAVFEDADLSEAAGDGWAEYDEKAGEPVGVSGWEAEFRLHKGK
jgi:hypothetical protein